MSEKLPTPDSISNNYSEEQIPENGLIVATSKANNSYSRDGTPLTPVSPGHEIVLVDDGWEVVDGELVEEQGNGATDNLNSTQQAPPVQNVEVPVIRDERIISPPPEQTARERERSPFDDLVEINKVYRGNNGNRVKVGGEYLNEGRFVRYGNVNQFGRQRIGKEYVKEGDRLPWSIYQGVQRPRILMHAADGTTYYARGNTLYNLDEIRRTGKRVGTIIEDINGRSGLAMTTIGMPQILPDGSETAPISKATVDLGSLIATSKQPPHRGEDPFEAAEGLLSQYEDETVRRIPGKPKEVQYLPGDSGAIRMGLEFSIPGAAIDFNQGIKHLDNQWTSGEDRRAMIQTSSGHRLYLRGDKIYDLTRSEEAGMPVLWDLESSKAIIKDDTKKFRDYRKRKKLEARLSWDLVTKQYRENIIDYEDSEVLDLPALVIGKKWKLAPDYVTDPIEQVVLGYGFGDSDLVDGEYENRGEDPFAAADKFLRGLKVLLDNENTDHRYRWTGDLQFRNQSAFEDVRRGSENEIQDTSPEGMRNRTRLMMNRASQKLMELHFKAGFKLDERLTGAQEAMMQMLEYGSDVAREKRRQIASGALGALALGNRGLVYVGFKAGRGRVKVQENLRRAADYYNSEEFIQRRRQIARGTIGALLLGSKGVGVRLGVYPGLGVYPKNKSPEDENN
ncbi:MAG: hypothetical protein ACHQT9_04325 [Candidatus Saccharimonadales bacterium]